MALSSCDLDDRELQVEDGTFCDTYVKATVNRLFSCQGGSGRAAGEMAKLFDNCKGVAASMDAGAIAFDKSASLACLRDLGSLPCQESPPSCARVYVGQVPALGACYRVGPGGPDECVPGSRCVTSTQCPGTCLPYRRLGEPCSADDSGQCDPSLSCNPIGVCEAAKAPAKVGDPCSPGSCDDLVCEGPDGPVPSGSTNGTCQPPRADGPCDESFECSGRCVGADLVSSGMCRPFRVLGEPCVPGQRECGAGTYCGVDNRCVDLPIIGESCAGNAGEGTECVDGLCDGAQSGAMCVGFHQVAEDCKGSQSALLGITCGPTSLQCDPDAQVCLPVCRRDASCGGLGEVCCLGRTCHAFATCSGETCVVVSGCQGPGLPLGLAPDFPLITDFSDASVTTTTGGISLNGGIGGGIAGHSTVSSAPGSSPPRLSLTTQDLGDGPRPALQVDASTGLEPPGEAANPWVGFGFNFTNCVDASAFAGVTFTLTGDLGRCALSFGAVFSADLGASFDPKGICVAPVGKCVTPSSGPLAAGRVSVRLSVRFLDLSGGAPQPTVNPAELTGIEWRLTAPMDPLAPPCVASFTVSDLSFFR